MNDAPPPLPPELPDYQDRRGGLIGFGICVILLGVFFALMVPISLLGQFAVARQSGGAMNAAVVAPGLLLFTALAGGCVCLGVGSIQAKRWARALLLIFGWFWLCVGVAATVIAVPTLRSMDFAAHSGGQQLPPGAENVAKTIAFGLLVLMYLVVPIVLICFYGSRNVRLTCEHRDPVERWTDRCPLPVLACCLLQVYGGVSTLLSAPSGALPLAGEMLAGPAAWIFLSAIAAFLFYAAVGFYRLRHRIWLVYTVVMTILGISGLASFAQVNLVDYYRATGLTPEQLAQVQNSPFAQGKTLLWLIATALALYLGYLLYLRKYFVAAREDDAVSESVEE